MKKVFAFLSTLLLTIAFVGIFAVSKPAAAANKITEDPTLAEDEIPVYIMNSIYTTFPNYYDNDAKADENWPGPSRMYPWNETRMRVAQFDEDGNPTGKYYAVYFSGHTVAVNTDGSPVIGAGKNILFWNVDANGAIVAEKYSDGKKASSGNASDPSLSHMRTNISGQDLVLDPTQYALGDEGTNYYNRSIVFDGEGRVIRAIGLDGIYTKDAGDHKMAPEFCYVDGVVTKMDENTVCDKVLTPEVDADGNPVLDSETGEPVMKETDELKIVYSRFVYEYFAEKPENVNEVAYLSEGWDPALWDYCFEEGDGYVCIAFVGTADNTAHKVKGDQVAAYEKTLIAQGKTAEEASTIANNSFRECVREFRIPAGGWVFDYGYLDRGTGNDVFFNDTVIKGYKYGRQVVATETATDEEGNEVTTNIYPGAQRTYNFSVSGLYFRDKVIDGQSYQLLNGQNVVEVMQGTEVKPAQQIIYDGIMRYWGTPNDLTSYTASAEALEFYVTESKNGGNELTAVQPPQGYTSLEAIKEEFLADCAAHKGVSVEEIKFDTAANWQGNWSWGAFFATNADNGAKPDYPSAEAPSFWNVPANREKWLWLLEQIYATMLEFPGGDTYTASLSHVQNAINSNFCGSPQTIAYAIWYFLNGQTHGYFGFNFGDTDEDGVANSESWIDATPSKDKWDAYTLDATMAAPNDNWVVTYKVVNADTGVSSELTIKYVVVDSYTPIIKVDNNKLYYKPKRVADLVVCDPIDPYTIVTAYDAQYNGVNILGNDISQYIEFETDLDFANPKEGNWPVVATIYNNAGTKKAVAKFTIQIVDITAPNAVVRKVFVKQGDNFDVRDGIVLAVDNVDGDLTKQAYTWWEETSKPVDTTKVNGGKDTTYTVKVTIFDKTGNEKSVSYTLVVVADKFGDQGKAQLQSMTEQVENLSNTLLDIIDAQDDLKDLIAELQGEIAELSGLNAEVEALKAAVAELAGLKGQLDELNAEVGSLKDDLATLNESVAELAELKGQLDELNTEVGSLKASLATLNESVAGLSGLKAQIEALKTEVSATNKEVGSLKAEVETVKNTISGVKTDVENVQSDLDGLEGNVNELLEFSGKTEETLNSMAAGGCKKNATALVLEIAGAAALLAFVLRKRH